MRYYRRVYSLSRGTTITARKTTNLAHETIYMRKLGRFDDLPGAGAVENRRNIAKIFASRGTVWVDMYLDILTEIVP